MTVKELQKLRRQELLQLLLAQSQEIAQIQAKHAEQDQEIVQLQENNRHLQEKTDEKDALIRKLEGRISRKDAQARKLAADIEAWRIEREAAVARAGSVAGAALNLNGIFETASQAVDQYLYNIRKRYGVQGEAASRQHRDMEGADE